MISKTAQGGDREDSKMSETGGERIIYDGTVRSFSDVERPQAGGWGMF